MTHARSAARIVLATLIFSITAGAVPVVAAPHITGVAADVTVFADNWIVGADPLGEIIISFDEPVIVPAGAVVAYTLDAAGRAVSVAPLGTATSTLTITFDVPVADNLVTVVLADGKIKSSANNTVLDGETVDARNPVLPSGDGQAGGAGVLRFAVLRGDANRSEVFTANDTIFVGTRLGACEGDASYDVRGDLNDDGCIDAADQAILFPLDYGRQIPAVADTDDDGAGDATDNCPNVANATQANGDADALGDACDNCPTVANANQANGDGDTIGDACDNCPLVTNADQANSDGDSVGNACDGCPNDAAKTAPGGCGCGVADTDQDSDTVLGCVDNCPSVANLNQADADADTVGDACDACPGKDDRKDADSDGKPDDCDNCKAIANPTQTDTDTDGFGNVCDNCPTIANPTQINADGDTLGDACDLCPKFVSTINTDTDTDGFGNVCDNCPNKANADQADADTDGKGNVCDNCPDFANPAQGANDCLPDEDDDGILDGSDLCPNTPASGVVDGDGCTEFQLALRDDDGDNIVNGADVCPNTSAGAVVNLDGCSAEQLGGQSTPTPTPTATPTPNNDDADGDGVKNEFDLCANTPANTTVDMTGCPLDGSQTPPPQEIPEGECGAGAPCGALGLANIYFLFIGLGWLRRGSRRR